MNPKEYSIIEVKTFDGNQTHTSSFIIWNNELKNAGLSDYIGERVVRFLKEKNDKV